MRNPRRRIVDDAIACSTHIGAGHEVAGARVHRRGIHARDVISRVHGQKGKHVCAKRTMPDLDIEVSSEVSPIIFWWTMMFVEFALR